MQIIPRDVFKPFSRTVNRLFMILSIGSAALLMTGCGFHLRGSIELPPGINSIYLQTDQPNRPFVITLSHLIASNHLAVTTEPDAADIVIRIDQINHDSQLVALSGSAQAGQYELTGQVIFSVTNQQGQVLIPRTFVRTSTLYTSNATQILSSETQTEKLWKEMQVQLANQILDQLAKLPASPYASTSAPAASTHSVTPS